MAAARRPGHLRFGADEAGFAPPLRILLWSVLGLFVLGIALVVLAVPATLSVATRLDDGRTAMQQARGAVIHGNARAALGRFRFAKVSFDEAAAKSRSGILRFVRAMPILGSNVDVVSSLSSAGSRTAQAGIEVADAVSGLPNGLQALAPSDGRIPLERMPPLGEALGRAHLLVDAALRDVRSSATSGLLPPVQDARSQAASSLGDLDTTLSSAAGLIQRLPSFLGADGTRTYLFGAENPAELRGAGGLIGAYSLMRARDGRLSFSPFRPVESLPLLDPDAVQPPNADYHRLYDPQRDGDGFWLNANMTPDFPSAAMALEAGFQAAEGRTVDGVVTADPFALRALLQATGPTEVPKLGVRITQQTVVGFLANGAYAKIRDPAERKLVLGSVAESVVHRYLGGAGSTESVRAVADAAGDGHIKLYSNDVDLEAALAHTGAGGAFAASATRDVLSVVVNNGGGNKVDYYVNRDVRTAVTLGGDGSASARTSVALENHSPTGGLPRYVLGPRRGFTDRAGQDVPILNVYCGACRITGSTRDGEPIDRRVERELGVTFAQDYFTIDPGTSATTTFTYDVANAWSGDGGGGTYTLRFLNQVTIRPTRVTVSVRVPDGMHVTDASEGMTVDGSVATWSGVPGRTLELEVSFAPPLPQRLWHSLVG